MTLINDHRVEFCEINREDVTVTQHSNIVLATKQHFIQIRFIDIIVVIDPGITLIGCYLCIRNGRKNWLSIIGYYFIGNLIFVIYLDLLQT